MCWINAVPKVFYYLLARMDLYSVSFSGHSRLGGGSGQDVEGSARQADHLSRQGLRRQGSPRMHPAQLRTHLRCRADQSGLEED